MLAAPGFAGVTITSPSVANPGSPVHFVASGASSCAKGIAAMGIYTAPSVLAYKISGSKIDTLVPMNPGSYDVVVQQWDHCGASASAHMILDVGAPVGKQTFADLQSQSGWSGFALLPPAFGICTTCKSSGPELNWSWIPNVSSPSMSGKSTKSVYGGGTVQWGDVLWNNHLIGSSSSQGLYDWSRTLVQQYTDFTYDVYFWIKDASVSQAVEFDINQFFGGKSFIWGHECRIAGGHQWDTWNNQTKHWVPSGIPCNPLSGAWNHLIIHVQRTPNNQLLFNTITLNGKTATLNRYDTPTATSWHGITINYQIDGNINGTPYNVFVDKLNFTIQ
ncbi:MAG: hypothetical protein JF563_01815 [Acidobacteriales bacterium]|nr:hypothetical protein [Terriglobales bacterium]